MSRVSGGGGSSGLRSGFFSGSVDVEPLTTHSRRPSGDQASPSASFGRSVSWRASPPSANGRSQTWVPPSVGASALPGLGTAATGLQHGAAIRQEGERPTVRAPARCGVGLASDGQLTGRCRAVGRRDPERAAVAVLAGRHRLDGEGHPAAVGREADRSGRGGRRGPRGAARVLPSGGRSPGEWVGSERQSSDRPSLAERYFASASTSTDAAAALPTVPSLWTVMRVAHSGAIQVDFVPLALNTRIISGRIDRQCRETRRASHRKETRPWLLPTIPSGR